MQLLTLCVCLLALLVPSRAQGNSTTTSSTTTESGVSPEPAIVNGQPAQRGEIPWQAAVYQHDPQAGLYGPCGGSLIQPLWVVTAAHCFPYPNARTEVRLGGINVNQMSYNEFAQYRIIHEEYTANPYYNDIALIRLSVPASGPEISPIIYANSEWGDLVGFVVQVSGYGQMGPNQPTSENLYKTNLQVITNEQCQQSYGQPILTSMMCAQWFEQPAQSACQGDSGGPLITYDAQNNPVLVGTVSFGRPVCDQGDPNVFTRVSAFSGWLTQTMQRNG